MKMKVLKLTQNTLFGCFYADIRKKLMPYLKLAPSIMSKFKTSYKKKIFKFGTKNALFGYF